MGGTNSEKNQFSNESDTVSKKSQRQNYNAEKSQDEANGKQNNNIKEQKCQCECEEGVCDCETNEQDFCECNSSEEIEKKQSQITQLENKVKEYLFSAQCLQADFDNFRKKAEIKIEQAKTEGQIEAIAKILPALDSFSGARKMIQDKTVLEGLSMVENQLFSALQSLRVEKIEAVGKSFDPNLHNALAVVEDSSLEDNIIKEEYQSGYKLSDKVIRHSQVIVNKKEEK